MCGICRALNDHSDGLNLHNLSWVEGEQSSASEELLREQKNSLGAKFDPEELLSHAVTLLLLILKLDALQVRLADDTMVLRNTNRDCACQT